jgi:hypothetical protein
MVPGDAANGRSLGKAGLSQGGGQFGLAVCGAGGAVHRKARLAQSAANLATDLAGGVENKYRFSGHGQTFF